MRLVVGALVKDEHERVYAHRRSPTRRLLPGVWDVVGGHVEDGESPEQALAREIEEETGWRLRRIEAVLAEWEWTGNGETRHELDYLVEVDGDLAAPRLEDGKHDAYAWIDQQNLDLMMVGRSDGDRRLRDIVAKATRSRVTERLRLVPIGPEHAEDFWRVHQDEVRTATEAWTWSTVQERVRDWAEVWEQRHAHRWMAYRRDSGVLVGCGGLGWCTVEGATVPEVGFSLLQAYRGQGYATELGLAALQFARDTLGRHTVVAVTEVDNHRSRAVMKRLGMRERETYHEGDTPMVRYHT